MLLIWKSTFPQNKYVFVLQNLKFCQISKSPDDIHMTLVWNTQPEIQTLNWLYCISVVNIIIIVCIIVSKYVIGMYISLTELIIAYVGFWIEHQSSAAAFLVCKWHFLEKKWLFFSGIALHCWSWLFLNTNWVAATE